MAKLDLLAFGLTAVFVGVVGCTDDDEQPGPTSPTGGTGGTAGAAGSGGTAGAGGSGLAGGTGGAGGAGGAGAAAPRVRIFRGSIQPEEVAILVNSNDAQSVAVASYYASARSIPSANVITVTIPTSTNTISAADFAAAWSTVDAAVGTDIQAFVLSWTRPYRVDCMSIATAFAVGEFNNIYCSSPCSPTASVDYYDSDSFYPFTDHGIRPTMSLAAAQESDAYALIDRGVASDQTYPMGDGYFLRTTDSARSVRWPNHIQTVADWDYPEGLNLT
ncbi:MAG: TIGR03790 family protein [Deltaproteobacteria bacterium]|jgi:hypothetical protein|nr:TIGR03790 family protein [Deltaproteobacteria bacterium]